MRKTLQGIIGATALIFAFAIQTRGQNALQFTAARVTDEGSIYLEWASQSNHVYQIQCADALIDTNTGTTTWQVLYDEYPSQGSNTFWTDHGNYFYVPPILDPKFMPMRFYQVVDTGPDTTSDEPTVSITSPTNGSTASGELFITVAASTDQATLSTKLYVDGQEMNPPVDTTNWVDETGVTNYIVDTYAINTSEWHNESHTLFGTARCASAFDGPATTSPQYTAVGHAVSPFLQVSFNNLVAGVSFSQYFFDPTAGQTQQVSAVFAANVNWTLQIRDINSNEVRTATGSGTSMQFNWDGNGDGGTNLPAGVYYYYLTAQTNGQPFQASGTSGSDSSSISSLAGAALGNSTGLWAMPSDGSGDAVPLSLYPPACDTNDLIILDGPPPIPERPSPSVAGGRAYGSLYSGSDAQTPDYSGASSESAADAPQRPPNWPLAGTVGTVAVAYDTYTGNGSNGFSLLGPNNGFPGGGFPVQMQGNNGNQALNYAPRPQNTVEADNFITAMRQWGWQVAPVNADNQLQISALRGSGTFFNQSSLGVLLTHGTYGSSTDYTANDCKQMYFPITSGTSIQYLRMSEMNLGGPGTNGLKWMALPACFSLYHANWQSMQNQQTYPYNNNLHLLLGSDTASYTDDRLLQYWAYDMLNGNPIKRTPPMTIQNAWFAAAKSAYALKLPASVVVNFAVAGDAACRNDMLQIKTNTVLSGTPFYLSQQVFP